MSAQRRQRPPAGPAMSSDPRETHAAPVCAADTPLAVELEAGRTMPLCDGTHNFL